MEIDRQTGNIRELVKEDDRMSLKKIWERTKETTIQTFLPAGYPHTVSKEYYDYSIYGNMGTISMTIMMFLSTQALFVALGGTTTQATLGAAAYTWVIKDGLGQLGGILFASRYGTNFDENIRKWRFISIFALNLAVYTELCTLLYP